jgi:hypothetical protein
MVIARRAFLGVGASIIAHSLAQRRAFPAPFTNRQSVTDFGVQPNIASDQTNALQNALHSISATGQIAYIPPGTYRARDIRPPAVCSIVGDAGKTILQSLKIGSSVIFSENNNYLEVNNVIFDGRTSKNETIDIPLYLIMIQGGRINFTNCLFRNSVGGAPYLTEVSGNIRECAFTLCNHNAVVAWDSRDLTIEHSRFEDCRRCVLGSCKPSEIWANAVIASGEIFVRDNTFVRCSAGIELRGSGSAEGNHISQVDHHGILLGSPRSDGFKPRENAATPHDHTVLIDAYGKAQDGSQPPLIGPIARRNFIQYCDIAIAARLDRGERILIADNAISGARGGVIRVLEQDKPVGPDLATSGVASYRNITIVGNVAR